MKPKKLDRWEREVEKLINNPRVYSDTHSWSVALVNLLRKQHKWVEQMIKDYNKQCIPPGNERCVEAWEGIHYIEKTCDDILTKLKERAR